MRVSFFSNDFTQVHISRLKSTFLISGFHFLIYTKIYLKNGICFIKNTKMFCKVYTMIMKLKSLILFDTKSLKS